MLFRQTFFCALLFTAAGCDSLRNRADRIAIECGLEQKSVHDFRHIKVLASQGSDYDTTDIKALKTQFQNTQGDIQALPLTPRACVILPNEEGIFQVVDTRNGESLTRTIKKEATQLSLVTLNLAPKPEIQASLSCPDEGLFASETLAQPLSLNISGEIAGLDVRVDLFTQDGVFVKTMQRKTKGQTELAFPANIDIRDVKEGSYLLKIYGNHTSQGIDSRPQLLSSEKICKLNILRGTVYVGGFAPETKQLVYPPRTNLPWTIQNPFEKLFVCKEQRSLTGQVHGNQSASCKPQNTCIDAAHYKQSILVSTEDPGIFDYFVYAENRAGNKSELKCQTVIVSDTPPVLSVNWAHDDLRKPGSILRKPYAILKADIETRHDLISDSNIQDNLTCKVDFEIKGKNSYAEKGVLCTEGRCKGQSLADFVPCDKNLAFTIVDALNQPTLMSSRLRLTIKSTDGAGHTAEAQSSVWINHTVWEKQVYDFVSNGSALSLASFLIDPSSDIIGRFVGGTGEQLASFTGNQWLEVKPDDQGAFQYNLARSRDGTIRVARILRFDEKYRVDVFGYKLLKLDPIAVTTDDNLIHGCWTFLVGPQDATYCMGSYVNEISQLVDKKWVPLPSPLASTESAKSLALEWRILSNGWVAGVSTTDLFIWNGFSWTRNALRVSEEFSGSPDLIEDFKGNLWLYGRSKQAEAYGLYKIVGNDVIPFPAPARLTHIFIEISHPKSFDGLKHFLAGAYAFNFMTETWEPSRYPAQDSGENDNFHPMMNDSNNTFTLLGNKGFFENNNDLLYWPTKSLGHDARSQGQSIERSNKALYFIDNSRPNNLSRLARIKTSFVSSFDSSMTGSADTYATGSWNTADGQTIVTFSDGTQFNISTDRIEKKKSPENFRDALQVFALKSGGYCISRVNGYWLYKPESNKYENFAPDESGRGSLQQCTEDSSGRLWWFHFFDNTLHVYDGVASRSVPILLKDGETIKAIKAVTGYSNLLIATTQRLVLLDSNDQIQRMFTLNDIASDGQITALEFAVMLNTQEILVQAENPSKLKIFFTVNLLSGVSTPETEFKRIVGEFGLIRSSQWQDTTFVLMNGPKAVFMQRTNRKWKELGNNIFDYQHVMLNKAAKPWWFAADTSGRLWFIASPSPYTFGRVDPDLAP